ncbi:MAG: acetoacetate--CoA ligase [Pseudomonadales bacterium]
MNDAIWTPSQERINASQLHQFQQYLNERYHISFENYASLHQWSIVNRELFWESMWTFSDIRSSTPYQAVLTNGDKLPGSIWFEGARLNYSENLLKYRDNQTALVSLLENGQRRTLSYSALYSQVEQLAAALRQAGIKSGDRVVGFMPNIIETVVAMLATTSIGALWSSCSPDFGINGVMDRFGQIEPKILFATDGYFYNEKAINTLPRLTSIREKITSLEKVIVTPLVNPNPSIADIDNAILFDDFLIKENTPALLFEQLPFNHPLYILYSSGTTGVPKCIIHSAGGTLIQHLKELKLHTDINRDDTFFYFSTCGWMMWNWLVSGLACGCTVVLFDGSPFAGKGRILIDAIDNENISVFGSSAKFIVALEKSAIKPRETHQLKQLKTILSTGSPLAHESFDYIYRDFKQDICLSSISGGTDIISCFALGNPTLAVYKGELQCRGLGMAVEIFNDNGNPVYQQKGELVCTKAFPSCPIGFWNDASGETFHNAYFNLYDNIWAHGDYGEITDNNGLIIHGRSDAVLNPGGVRIGTAEIYRQVEKIDQVLESIVIGQEWQGDVRVVLFVILREGITLDEQLINHIKQTICSNTSRQHVPSKVIQVDDIPRTISGKIVELAVKQVIHGQPVKNIDALANPQTLELYKSLKELAIP